MAATAMMWGCDAVKAQTLEPEFEGEVVGVFPDGSSKKLEKHNVRMRTGAGVYIAGFAASKSKTKVLVEGGSTQRNRSRSSSAPRTIRPTPCPSCASSA